MSEIRLSGSTLVGEKFFDFHMETSLKRSISIIGPNGAGKSTLLRILGGHQKLDNGTLEINGVIVDSPTQNIFLPPYQRSVVLQTQTGAVFPHLNVQDNVAFSFRSRNCSKKKAREQIATLLEDFKLESIRLRSPQTLSGGQLARVALARSIASRPEVLLLDEPSASLDIESISEIHDILEKLATTLVFASHNPLEVLRLSDSIIAVDNGKVMQIGSIKGIASSPATSWISKFLDLNLVSGDAAGYNLELHGGGSLNLSEKHFGAVQVSFPSSAVSIHKEQPSGSPRNKWEATVISLDMEEGLVRIGLSGQFESLATIMESSFSELGLELGSSCWASIKATELKVLPTTHPARK